VLSATYSGSSYTLQIDQLASAARPLLTGWVRLQRYGDGLAHKNGVLAASTMTRALPVQPVMPLGKVDKQRIAVCDRDQFNADAMTLMVALRAPLTM